MFESCIKVKRIMDKFGLPWFVCGGRALDLFLLRDPGSDAPVEIGIYRKHQMKLFRYFPNSKKFYLDNRSRIGKIEKREWTKEYLRVPVRELVIPVQGFDLRVFLHEGEDERGKGPEIGQANGIPYLSPEIVLRTEAGEMLAAMPDMVAAVWSKMETARKEWLLASIADATAREALLNLPLPHAPPD